MNINMLNKYKTRYVLAIIISILCLYSMIWYIISEYYIKPNLFSKAVHAAADLVSSAEENSHMKFTCNSGSEVSGFPFHFILNCNKPNFLIDGYKISSNGTMLVAIPIFRMLKKFNITAPDEIEIRPAENFDMNSTKISMQGNRYIKLTLVNSLASYLSKENLSFHDHLRQFSKVTVRIDSSNIKWGMFENIVKINSKIEGLVFDMHSSYEVDAINSNFNLDIKNLDLGNVIAANINADNIKVSGNMLVNKQEENHKFNIFAGSFLQASLNGHSDLINNSTDMLLDIYKTDELFNYINTNAMPIASSILINNLIDHSDVYNKDENKLSYRFVKNNGKIRFGRFYTISQIKSGK